jgi:hypothetical protein
MQMLAEGFGKVPRSSSSCVLWRELCGIVRRDIGKG